MNKRTITIESQGKTYGGQIGVIKSTRLGYDQDRGIFTAWISVEWKGGGVGVGGISLDAPPTPEANTSNRIATAFGHDHIIKILDTVGVRNWESLVGKHVIVLFSGESAWGSASVGIASATDEDKVLVFSKHAEHFREALAEEVQA